MNLKFFKTPAAFRKWLTANHAKSKELWVGFYKKNSGKPSLTWPESVDEALCFGWIDGLRKNVDADSYKIRFSPRKPASIWSAVNIRNVERLSKEKRMQLAGLKAYDARKEYRSGIYSYEQRSHELVDRQREAGRDEVEAPRQIDRRVGAGTTHEVGIDRALHLVRGEMFIELATPPSTLELR